MIAVVLLFLSLGLDTLAVAVGLGLSGLPRSQWRRVGLTFAFFEGLMPVVGLLVGHRLSHAFGVWGGYRMCEGKHTKKTAGRESRPAVLNLP